MMAAIKSVFSLNFGPKWLLVVLMALVLSNQMAQSQTQTCSNSLANLNVCAPFVVPGAANTSPSLDCCTALQGLEHDCICNTLRIVARLPVQCNLPSFSCGEYTMEHMVDDCVVDSTNENVMENMNMLDEPEKVGEDGATVPEVGMIFSNENDMWEFYKRHAYSVGFPVRKRNSKRGDDGALKFVTFTCSREGKSRNSESRFLKPQPTIQTDCKARISASSDNNGSWRINRVILEHNHKTSPTKSRLYRCNRELSAHVKRKLEVNDMAGIPLHKSYNSAVVEAGGYEKMTCIEKDCRNYIEQVRRLKLGDGDAAAIQSYFSDMQAQCAGFFFSMDLDEESRLKNVFWADNRCRKAYEEFGDVVTFDTTYLTNKYDMPFAPFVGVNHHGQSILLGCGLVCKEDTDTFVWLFSTWLKCMHGKSPIGIITDQDRAMQNAIRIVFPNTRHRWCLWHILKKLPEKFGYHINKSGIFATIHGLVYDSQYFEEFEEGWEKMIDKYELNDNDWLSGLYEDRSRWVPCFLNTSMWAGMSTTQRSESMNAFFYGYVHSKTSLKQFVEQYERALRNKAEKEFQADFKSYSQMLPCTTTFEIEKQFQSVYTIEKFREVQAEFAGKMYCDVISTSETDSGMRYEVREIVVFGGGRKTKSFSVFLEKDICEFSCSCHLFEFRGIICRHAIAVLFRCDITVVPERYILRRWRRDVVRAHTRVAVNYNGMVNTPGQVRYDNMCRSFAEVADLAAENEEKCCFIMEWIELQRCDLMLARSSGGSNFIPQHTTHFSSQSTASGSIRDPVSSKTKGAPKKLRKKSPLESRSRKAKAVPTSSKGRRMKKNPSNLTTDPDNMQAFATEQDFSSPATFSYSELLLGGSGSQDLPQQLPASNLTPPTSTFIFTSQDHMAGYYYPQFEQEFDRGL